MATVSGVITFNTDKLLEQCRIWADYETFPREAQKFIDERLYPLINSWNTLIALTEYFPTVSGTEADLLYQVLENYRAGYNIHDSYDIATGARDLDTLTPDVLT